MSASFRWLMLGYGVWFFLLAIYSYSFLDINLTFTSWAPFLAFQKTIRLWGLQHRTESAIIFSTLILLMYWFYYRISKIYHVFALPKQFGYWLLLIGACLTAAYPLFSHDIYNYIFNAKMVLVYHANPHLQVARDFSGDPMLFFMRNVHTPAPYWYIWTGISLIPSILTFNRIFSSVLVFKLFSFVQLLACGWMLNRILYRLRVDNRGKRLALFLLNPLILIEAVGIGHNDLSMMFLALYSFYWLLIFRENKKSKFLVLSLVLLLLSGGIKYATLILLPFYLIYLFYFFYLNRNFDIGLWGAVALFLLPFARIEQLHSWYLIWPLTWIFLSRSQKAINFLIALSFFALLRYIPYIYFGNWDPPVFLWRIVIYLGYPLIWLIGEIVRSCLPDKA